MKKGGNWRCKNPVVRIPMQEPSALPGWGAHSSPMWLALTLCFAEYTEGIRFKEKKFINREGFLFKKRHIFLSKYSFAWSSLCQC